MIYRVALVLAISALLILASAQEASDCPARTVIRKGCVSKDNCLYQVESPVCYVADPQYTDEAAKANVKGTVKLTATIRTDGCASDIKVIDSLGYGLDEAAVSALERYRFHKPAKPMTLNLEFDFDPKFSSRDPVTAPRCNEIPQRDSSAR